MSAEDLNTGDLPQLASNDAVVTRLLELSKKIDSIWAETNLDITTEEIVESLRESRSRTE